MRWTLRGLAISGVGSRVCQGAVVAVGGGSGLAWAVVDVKARAIMRFISDGYAAEAFVAIEPSSLLLPASGG